MTLTDPGPLPRPDAASTDISKTVRTEYGEDAVCTDRRPPRARRVAAARPRHRPKAPLRFRATGVQGAAEAHAWLHDFARDTAHRCESAAEQLAFAGCVCAMLATELGPERTWRVYPHVEGAPLKTALCCGYDAVVVRSDGGAVLLATGMYCG